MENLEIWWAFENICSRSNILLNLKGADYGD